MSQPCLRDINSAARRLETPKRSQASASGSETGPRKDPPWLNERRATQPYMPVRCRRGDDGVAPSNSNPADHVGMVPTHRLRRSLREVHTDRLMVSRKSPRLQPLSDAPLRLQQRVVASGWFRSIDNRLGRKGFKLGRNRLKINRLY